MELLMEYGADVQQSQDWRVSEVVLGVQHVLLSLICGCGASVVLCLLMLRLAGAKAWALKTSPPLDASTAYW